MQKSRYARNPLRLLLVLPAPIARAGPELPEVEIARRVIAEHALRPEDADRLYHALQAALRSAIASGGAHRRGLRRLPLRRHLHTLRRADAARNDR